ncbi:hypothetical protein A3J15_01805 [Candidatus Roizmanbacteria bacterium RIFCSPLOWO2_02_FULL_38_10]|uniref:rRNA maturation RNase YbeY n=1 Tax=Candidatus Roizmanbacteria bacterium RIFCSPLOWO2_02_FULL_38_10 TaxID=1802074 RepID=A0A1F7JKG4_9BACT|nr:MAG: hypothetical protein A3J15_01805 [Candidatus Roizmanbacteria bacterium RIFCSPLOWO2_02_FULL_38_10]
MIIVNSDPRYHITKKKIKLYASSTLLSLGISDNYDVNIIFVGKRKMKTIAYKYKHENFALPVLTFPYVDDKNEQNKLLGEIFICYPQALLLAAEKEKKVYDMIEQLIEHGIKNLVNET